MYPNPEAYVQSFGKSEWVRLAQDNDMVHTFAPDRSDQPFGKSILPGIALVGRAGEIERPRHREKIPDLMHFPDAVANLARRDAEPL